MGLNCVDDAFELMKLFIYALKRLFIVDSSLLEELVCLENEWTGGGDSSSIAGLEVNEGIVADSRAIVLGLASFCSRLHADN